MERYRIEEVTKMLIADARLEFDRVNDDPTIKFKPKARILTNSLGDLLIKGRIKLRDKWCISPYMVSFEEASKAFSEGKAVRCKYFSKLDCKLSTKLFEVGENGNMNPNDDLTFYMITEGKWFIEDDWRNWNKDTVD